MGRKTDVTNILTKGTPKQRLILLFSHHAEILYSRPGLLTEEEARELLGSFKTSKEIELYQKTLKINANLKRTIAYLTQLKLAYGEQIAYLRGAETLWGALDSITGLLNNILQEIEGEGLRAKITRDILKTPLSYCEFGNKKGGEIVLKDTRPEHGTDLKRVIRYRRTIAEDFLRLAKPLIKAISDVMVDNGFKIKAYQRHLKEIEAFLEEDKATVFSRRKLVDALRKEDPEKSEPIRTFINSHSERFIYPDYNEIELDEELYKKYREAYLDE